MSGSRRGTISVLLRKKEPEEETEEERQKRIEKLRELRRVDNPVSPKSTATQASEAEEAPSSFSPPSVKRWRSKIDFMSLGSIQLSEVKRFSLTAAAVVEIAPIRCRLSKNVQVSLIAGIVDEKHKKKHLEKKTIGARTDPCSSVDTATLECHWETTKMHEMQIASLSADNYYLLVEVIETKNEHRLGACRLSVGRFSDDIQREEVLRLYKDVEKTIKPIGELILRYRCRPQIPVSSTIVMKQENFPAIPAFIYNSHWNRQCLRECVLVDCAIASIHPAFAKLTSLEVLILNQNQIAEIPSAMGSVFCLRHFEISHNRLVKLPGSLARLKNLSFFDLSSNQFESIETRPSCIKQLLEHCDIVGAPDFWSDPSTKEDENDDSVDLAEVERQMRQSGLIQ